MAKQLSESTLASWPHRRSWFVVWQPISAEQFSSKSMKIIDVWCINGSDNATKARDAAYVELNKRVDGYIAENGIGKISLLEGDLCAHHVLENPNA